MTLVASVPMVLAVVVMLSLMRRCRTAASASAAGTREVRSAIGPELNPVELLWSSLKKRELANLAGDHLADVADATEQGAHRINHNQHLPWPYLAHTGLTIQPQHPPNLRKDQ